MVGSRAITAAVGLLVGLAVSVLAWVYFDTLALFVLLPFVPILFRRRTAETAAPRSAAGAESGASDNVKACPRCGFETTAPDYSHCPRDGRRLMEPRRAERDYEP